MRASLLLATYKRNEHLRLCLPSIKKFNNDIEILVLNDGPDDDETRSISESYEAIYIWTGKNKKDKQHWRIPGFAWNIGAKIAKTSILIISCVEMWHVDNCIEEIVNIVENNKKAIASPRGKFDDGNFKEHYNYDLLNSKLNTKLCFLQAVHKDVFFDIGGFDETFTGICIDDQDYFERLIRYGCQLIFTEAKCVHIIHEKNVRKRKNKKEYRHNLIRLKYNRKNNIVKVNEGKEWGVCQKISTFQEKR